MEFDLTVSKTMLFICNIVSLINGEAITLRIVNESSRNYHFVQFDKIYSSTVDLVEFINKNISFYPDTVLDFACGAGANTFYLSKKFSKAKLTGIDIDNKLIRFANNQKLKHKNKNIVFKKIDGFKFNQRFDLACSFQSLSFISGSIYKPLKHLIKLSKKGIAFSTLIHNGPIDAKIQINDFSDKKQLFSTPYNILSMVRITEILKSNNFNNINYLEWQIPIDLIFTGAGMGSKTIDTMNKKKLIVSGPIILPYGFVYAERN